MHETVDQPAELCSSFEPDHDDSPILPDSTPRAAFIAEISQLLRPLLCSLHEVIGAALARQSSHAASSVKVRVPRAVFLRASTSFAQSLLLHGNLFAACGDYLAHHRAPTYLPTALVEMCSDCLVDAMLDFPSEFFSPGSFPSASLPLPGEDIQSPEPSYALSTRASASALVRAVAYHACDFLSPTLGGDGLNPTMLASEMSFDEVTQELKLASQRQPIRYPRKRSTAAAEPVEYLELNVPIPSDSAPPEKPEAPDRLLASTLESDLLGLFSPNGSVYAGDDAEVAAESGRLREGVRFVCRQVVELALAVYGRENSPPSSAVDCPSLASFSSARGSPGGARKRARDAVAAFDYGQHHQINTQQCVFGSGGFFCKEGTLCQGLPPSGLRFIISPPRSTSGAPAEAANAFKQLGEGEEEELNLDLSGRPPSGGGSTGVMPPLRLGAEAISWLPLSPEGRGVATFPSSLISSSVTPFQQFSEVVGLTEEDINSSTNNCKDEATREALAEVGAVLACVDAVFKGRMIGASSASCYGRNRIAVAGVSTVFLAQPQMTAKTPAKAGERKRNGKKEEGTGETHDPPDDVPTDGCAGEESDRNVLDAQSMMVEREEQIPPPEKERRLLLPLAHFFHEEGLLHTAKGQTFAMDVTTELRW